MNPPNKRRFVRVLFNTPALLNYHGKIWHGHIIDISLKGALFALDSAEAFILQEDRTCALNIALNEGSMRIKMEGLIAHQEDHRIGLTCRHIDIDSITHLRRLIELNLGDETLLDRELSAFCHASD